METVSTQGGSVTTFSISALERATGVPRSTIHFYIGEELLPRPAKTAVSRSLYTEKHVELLRRITELKESGLSLAEIRDELEPDIADASDNDADLAAREYERIHAAIIETAAREFAVNGYEDTHLSTIIKKVGTTRHVFYSHVDSKLHLLAECFKVVMKSSFESVEPPLETETNPAERLLARLASDPMRHTLRAEAVSLIRAKSTENSDVFDTLVQTYTGIVERVAADIQAMQPSGSTISVPIELLAYSVVGAFDNTQLRASWDDKYDRTDLLRAHLWLYFAIRAGLDGRVDIDSEVKRYEASIQEAASRE